ncbi:MAG: TolC family protein [Saprospiraceae bacterium]|nr:TolC family protein [Saprospiraceae bacterium]
MRSILNLLILLLFAASLHAQNPKPLTLEDCYGLARQNYPLIKQRDLIAKSKDYAIDNLAKGRLPQISFSGQATYQSDVTQIPIQLPGLDFPTPGKDQYKLYAEVSQNLYDGGLIREQQQAQEARTAVEGQQLEVELYKLKERVNQLFFGILLLDAQLEQTTLLKKDIRLGLSKTEAAIKNGVALRSSLDLLKAESLKADQRVVELTATRQAYSGMLALLVAQNPDEPLALLPPPAVAVSEAINRPELKLFDAQNQSLVLQHNLLAARNRPKVSLFLQTGFGRPALNVLSNDFEPYFIGGLRVQYPLSFRYTLKNDKALIDLSRAQVNLQQETFLFNTRIALRQQNAEIAKLEALLRADEEIIALRSGIKNTTSVQLENGVVNANDYLREVNAEDYARQNKLLHEIQLLMAQYNHQTTSGN